MRIDSFLDDFAEIPINTDTFVDYFAWARKVVWARRGGGTNK